MQLCILFCYIYTNMYELLPSGHYVHLGKLTSFKLNEPIKYGIYGMIKIEKF